MPQFVTTSGTAHFIEEIIIKARTELVLITPYLKLSRILAERLVEATTRGVHITLVYGKSALRPREKSQLEALTNLELLFLENLHAKCYYNDAMLIVSSMNLYEFSERTNREMGIVLTRREDAECFADALAEAHSIIRAARGLAAPARPPATSAALSAPSFSEQAPAKVWDRALVAHTVYELLKRTASRDARFQNEPHTDGLGLTAIVSAPDYPLRGIRFRYHDSIRFDFDNSQAYQTLKATRRDEIDRRLAAYRCYWNHNVLQVYPSAAYRGMDEQTAAAYLVQAIELVASVLQPARQ